MVFVAPYTDMANLARQYFLSSRECIDVVIGDLDAGLGAARTAIAKGAELIISRGGTAELIARHVAVPVVPIRVSGYDILRVLTAAFAVSRAVGVVGFESVVAGCRSVAHILGKELRYRSISESSQALDAVNSMVERGAQYIVGDMISVSVATGLGLPCSLVQSGVESIVQAVKESRQLLFHLRHQHHQNVLLQALLDNSRDAIVAVDAEGHVQFANQIARATYRISGEDTPNLFVGTSDEMRRVRRLVEVLGRDDCNVLILGETGSGKELVAQAIHCASDDAARPFVAVNCAAIPSSLLESELFGYADGAFTGARKGGRPGLFETASGGTLFLDEIGEMNIEAQARLLRVLQERSVRRVGEDRVIPVSVRVIAASNIDLACAAAEHRFRRDLFYRLNVAEIRVPALRERSEDISLLIDHLVQTLAKRKGCTVAPMRASLVKVAQSFTWPGNVRELRNFCERYIVLVRSEMSASEMVDTLFARLTAREHSDDTRGDIEPVGERSLREVIADVVMRTWQTYGGNITHTARALGIDRGTVHRYVSLEDFSSEDGVQPVDCSPDS